MWKILELVFISLNKYWHDSALITAHGVILITDIMGLSRTAQIHHVADHHSLVKKKCPSRNKSICHVIILICDNLINLPGTITMGRWIVNDKSHLLFYINIVVFAHFVIEVVRSSIGHLVIFSGQTKIILPPSRKSWHQKPYGLELSFSQRRKASFFKSRQCLLNKSIKIKLEGGHLCENIDECFIFQFLPTPKAWFLVH